MTFLRPAFLVLALSLTLGACATVTENRPSRTATEYLLLTRAIDQAARQFSIGVEPGKRVHLNTRYLSGEGADYAASAFREALVAGGARLAEDRLESDVIVEMRAGAMSIDQMNRLLGMPSLTIPTSQNLTTATIPELSVYSRRDRTGVVEFNAFAYETQSGRPVALATRVSGVTKVQSHKLFMILTWGRQELRPESPMTGNIPWWRNWDFLNPAGS